MVIAAPTVEHYLVKYTPTPGSQYFGCPAIVIPTLRVYHCGTSNKGLSYVTQIKRLQRVDVLLKPFPPLVLMKTV